MLQTHQSVSQTSEVPHMVKAKDMDQQLRLIKIARVKFTFVSEGDARLPRFLGSTLRGAYAHSTKKLTCALRNEDCPTCLLRERCVYSVIFESPRPEGATRFRGQQNIPHPIIIDPPAPSDEPFSKGKELDFTLTLFGKAIEHFPYLVVAARQMGPTGLGKQHYPFELVRAATTPFQKQSRVIYEPEGTLGELETEELGAYFDSHSAASDHVRLCFETPTRLVANGRLTKTPSPEIIIRSLAMRSLAILHFHSGKDIDIDVNELEDLARDVRIEQSNLELVRLSRHSSRQSRLIPLDGLIGDMTLNGPSLKKLWPLLITGEVVRLGKGTIFGLGRYRLEQRQS